MRLIPWTHHHGSEQLCRQCQNDISDANTKSRIFFPDQYFPSLEWPSCRMFFLHTVYYRMWSMCVDYIFSCKGN
jgi:hypothetical protein